MSWGDFLQLFRGGVSIVLVPERGGASRTVRLSARTAARWRMVLTAAAILLVGVVASWAWLARAAYRSETLKRQVDSLTVEAGRVRSLAQQLAEIEAEYEKIRGLFGVSSVPAPSELWSAPLGSTSRAASGRGAPDAHVPTAWPLAAAGFVTQALVEEGVEGEHPGLDIAVPTGSYVRASGDGEVIRVGEDPVYGLMVVLDHGGGYRTLYGHTSEVFVTVGSMVRRGEVIALSGSTGRSTAPHLHFEIRLNDQPVDPFSMMDPPASR